MKYWDASALVSLLVQEAHTASLEKLADIKTGLLINFNVTHLQSGIKRFVF